MFLVLQFSIMSSLQKPHFSHLNVLTEGFNGQLPNLDLFNLAVRLAHSEGIPTAVNNHVSIADLTAIRHFDILYILIFNTGRMKRGPSKFRSSFWGLWVILKKV